MKLYFAPGACSLAAHIALREADQPFTLEQVDLRAKQLKAGGDYRAINPKGSVPAIQLDDGQVLTEAAVILQYVADRAPQLRLAAAAGTMERYRLQEWLNWVATELHKGMSPFFNPRASDEWKQILRANLATRFSLMAERLGGAPYLLGDFTVADGYAYTILRWTRLHAIDLTEWPVIPAYMARVEARPAVQAALKAEGIIK
jgi:glutathione S-transferase